MNKHTSRLIKAMEGFRENLTPYSQQPTGMFGRVAKVTAGGATLSSEDVDIEFTIPFDDEAEPDEAEIIIYNLSNSTIQKFKYNTKISIEAGYKNDTGVVFDGYISKVTTKTQGLDKITTIKALTDMELAERKTVNVSFSAPVRASAILDYLIRQLGLPIGEIKKGGRDPLYMESVTLTGSLWDNIRKYAEARGVSVYIQNGKVYARHIKEGENISFIVSADTGLISVEEFEEEQQAEDYKEVTKGYKLEMILQHRMKTAAIINLSSVNAKGQFRVRSGEHTFSSDEAITKVEVI